MPVSIGSDSYGYSAYASNISGAYHSLSGQSGVSSANLAGDDSSLAFSLGTNRLRFYGSTYDSFYITTNGQLRFGDSAAPYSNTSLAAGNPPALSIYWDDLYVLSDSAVLYQYSSDLLTIEWSNIANYANRGGSRGAFQIVLGLNSGSADGQIVFNYFDTDFGSSSLNSGASATVGISSPAGYLQISSNSASSYVAAGQSVLFSTATSPSIAPSANTAPTTANRSVRINEDSTYTFSSSDFTFSDVDSGDTLKSVLITSAPAAGQLLYNGSSFTIGSSGYSIAKADLGKLSFVPAANANGDGYASFQFKVLDQADAASATATVTIDVTAVNDAPISLNALNNLDQAYEAGVSPLGQFLPAVNATGVSGSLFVQVVDPDQDLLLISGVLGLDATLTPTTSEWLQVDSSAPTRLDGLYGVLSVSSDGSYCYVVNEQHPVFLSLSDAQKLVDHFTLRISDGSSEPVYQQFNIGINGRDDVAKPLIARVSGDDRVNRAEKRNGILLTGAAYGAIGVDITWGSTNKHVPVYNGVWSAYFSTTTDPAQSNPLLAQISEVPDDWQDTTVRVTAYDGEGHASLVSQRSVVVDTLQPFLPWLDRVANDDIINASEKQEGFAITGRAEPGAIVNLSWASSSKAATVDALGSWSIRIDSIDVPFDDHDSTLLLTATDLAGNVSFVRRRTVTIDTVAPRTAILLPITDDGIININERSSGIRLTGHVESGSSLRLHWGGLVFSPTVRGSGSWSQWITPQQLSSLDLSDNIVATVTDDAGNTTSSTLGPPAYDLTAPSVPLVDSIGRSLRGKQFVNASYTSTGLLISGRPGSAEPASTIRVSFGRLEKTTLVSLDGSWNILYAGNELPADTSASVVSICSTDAAGNISPITTQTLIIDTRAPDTPIIKTIAGDDLISAAEALSGVIVQGTAEPGSLVTLNWSPLARIIEVSASGTWSCFVSSSELSLLSQGSTLLSAFATDSAGNRSVLSIKSVNLATVVPAMPTLDTVAGDNTINQIEARDGVALSGRSEANSTINILLGSKAFRVTADISGAWNLKLRATDLPVSDVDLLLQLTASNASGLTSAPISRIIHFDRTLPSLLSQSVSDNKLTLLFSEQLTASSLLASDFNVFENKTSVPVLNVKSSPSQPSMLELTLGRIPSAACSLGTTYSPSTRVASLADASGNPVAAFSNAIVTTYRTAASVDNLSPGYTVLELSGFDSLTGIGNAAANTIVGNSSANLIDGGVGPDLLTGLGGRDTFRFSLLTDSVLNQYDRITDLEIAVDRIDGPSPVASSAIRHLGAVSALTSTALQQLLQSGVFGANGAATFVFGNRTFLALNDSYAGFNSTRDAIIEITGYSGSLGLLEIV